MAKREDKRENIMKAAADAFTRYGYDKTTLDDIGRIVGLNKASLYYYYKNKEDLFLAVVLEESRRMIGHIQENVQSILDPESKILTYMTERLAYYRHVLSLNSVSTESLTTLQPAFNTLYNEIEQGEIQYVAGSLAKLNLQPGILPEQAATLLFKTANALKHEAVLQSGRLLSAEADYSQIEADIKTITGWMLKGIQHKSES